MAPWPMAVLAPSPERFICHDLFYLSRVSSALDILCKSRTPNTFSKFVLQITSRLYFYHPPLSFSRVTLLRPWMCGGIMGKHNHLFENL
jgi:hypothetical protein